MKIIWIILISLIVIFVVIKLALPYCVFPVNLIAFESPATDQTFVHCKDNRIAVLKVGEQFKNQSPIIVYSHGNAEYLTKRMQDGFESLASQMKKMIVLYDYPGYGRSSGLPSESGVNDCIDSVIRSLGVDDQNLVLVGRSIGSGPTIKWASTHHPRGVMLHSPFSSIVRVCLPFSIPGLDMFPSLDDIKTVKCPVLICHGKNDTIIPSSHGARLAEAAPDGTLVTKDAGHNDMNCDEDLREFVSNLS